MIYKIESKQNPKIKEVLLLKKSSYRNVKKEFIIEGFHLLEMALEKGIVKQVFLLKEDKDIPDDIPQYIVNEDIMQKISEEKSPQGVVAVCKMLEASNNFSNRVLYLDQVSDPGNVGTLLRTALAFFYKTVLLSPKSCSIYNPKVIQSSQGAIFNLNIIENFSDLSKLNDYQLIATEIKGSKSLKDFKPQEKHVLILGNEAHGVSKEILSLCENRIRIDISEIESLNVGVAGGIAMYELSK